MGFLHDKADADDLTQDIFIQAYQSLPRFKGDRKSSNNCSAECLQATAGWDNLEKEASKADVAAGGKNFVDADKNRICDLYEKSQGK
ncbi:MAG: hypothetical protein A2V46_11740 [Bacteroidetes bacterium RBG_19FT_COMBO_42_7]|nr:MAG: hypothetical protein A2V46_11740 [Bacteroidetes bacterium RBG_19FT_COMBO_42_7]